MATAAAVVSIREKKEISEMNLYDLNYHYHYNFKMTTVIECYNLLKCRTVRCSTGQNM